MLILIFSGLVAFSTVFYAILTWILVCETRKLRKVQIEPQISVRAEFSPRAADGALELVIRNEGQGGASNIKFEFKGDPTYFVESGITTPINEISALKDGLHYLGPNQRFDILIGWLLGDAFNKAVTAPWTFDVSYENLHGESRNTKSIVDFAQFDRIILRDSSPLFKIEKHLNDIQKHLARIRS